MITIKFKWIYKFQKLKEPITDFDNLWRMLRLCVKNTIERIAF